MQGAGPVAHSDPIAPVIFGVTVILAFALVGRFAARRWGQPPVLGELVMGVLLGNVFHFFGYELISVLREGNACLRMAELALAGQSWEQAAATVMGPEAGKSFLALLRGPSGGEYLQIAQAVDIFSRYGVILLLFHVGLDTCIEQLRRVGMDSLRVAVIGVSAPFVLGFSLAWLLMPGSSHALQLFLGATLGATSIGITARVLRDLNRTYSPEAHIILGAAVMDDVLGLVLLAIVSGIVVSGSAGVQQVAATVLLASLFILFALLLGPRLVGVLIWMLRRLNVLEAKLFISFFFVMTMAWTASLVGLASIVGAFAAGLLLLDSQFRYWGSHREHKYTIRELFAPIEAILAPIFFVLMGIHVKLETFLDGQVVLVALGLLGAAVAGKLLSGLGVRRRAKRLAVGIGMMPRGEVGLVFAAVGNSLGVIDEAIFSAVVLMVIVTTLLTPPLLELTLGQASEQEAEQEAQSSSPCE